MANIQVTPDLLRGKSDELRGLKEEHEAVMLRITNLINGLNDQWTGPAQEAFVTSFTGMKPTFDNLVNILQGYSDLMGKAAQEYESTDQAIKSAADSFS